MKAELLKLVVVGDGVVGKSSLLITFTTNNFPCDYVPTVFDHHVMEKTVYGKHFNIGLWDTAAQEDYDRLRPLAYPQTDIFLVCFDVKNRDSFENVREKWIPEISCHCSSAPRILVGCKSDLRASAASDDDSIERFVTATEAKQLAAELQCVNYLETSSLNGEGLDAVFDLALKAASLHVKLNPKKSKRSLFGALRRKENNRPLVLRVPPTMPPAGFAPEIEIETSIIGEQWLNMLRKASCSDTTLILSSGEEVKTHRTMLSSASSVFKKALRVETKQAGYKGHLSVLSDYKHPAILHVDFSHSPQSTYIYLSNVVTPEALHYALEFFYSGTITFDGRPSRESLDSLRKFSQLFNAPFLKQICDNVENGDTDLNPRIGTYLCDIVGQNHKKLFFDQKLHADPDVQFIFAERPVYAHKCLLSSRNEIMAAMFDGRFLEGNNERITTVDMSKDADADLVAFLVMLEFLYTGHAPLDEGVDPVSLLILSDRYNITRLSNLCELYITKLVDKKCSKHKTKSNIDVIGLLNVANLYNASQLTKWCRHFISTNYLPMSLRPEWCQLSHDDQQHIEEHRWPPVDYLNEVSEYERLQKENNKTAGEFVISGNDSGCLLM